LKRAINIRHGKNIVKEIIKKYGNSPTRKKKIILFGNDIVLGGYSTYKEGNSFRKNHITTFPIKAFGIEFDFALQGSYSNNINAILESLMTGTPLPELHPLDDPDQLPFPDRCLLTHYAQHGGTVDQKPSLQKSTLIRTSSGCLNTCIFCQRKAWNSKYQAHSIEYVSKEFSELKNHNYRNIWVTDDNFTFDLKRAKSLLQELSNRDLTVNMKIALSSWTFIDEEFLETAKMAHVSIISFGVETANPEIQSFYRKHIQLERFSKLIQYADQIGLYTVGNFIIGAPMETQETIDETFHYIMSTSFDQVNIKILDYMAGSELYESIPQGNRGTARHLFACEENGLNKFPLKVLKGKIKDFMEEFRQVREGRLKEKINHQGLPYFLL